MPAGGDPLRSRHRPAEREPWGELPLRARRRRHALRRGRVLQLKDVRSSPRLPEASAGDWPDASSARRRWHGACRAHRRRAGTSPGDWLVLERDYTSQSIDTAALEPDNANGWYDPGNEALHLVVRRRSRRRKCAEAARRCCAGAHRREAAVPPPVLHRRLRLQGPRDFPFYGAHRRAVRRRPPGAPGQRPLRAVPDCAQAPRFTMRYRIAVDREPRAAADGFRAVRGQRRRPRQLLALGRDGGATAAQSIYYFPKSDLAQPRSPRAPSTPARPAATGRCRAWPPPRW